MTEPDTGPERELDDFDHMLTSFERHLRAQRRSPKTIKSYLEAGNLLAVWARKHPDRPAGFADLTRPLLEDFIIAELDRVAASSVANRYRSLQQLYRWLTEVEEELEETPFARMSVPETDELIIPMPPIEHVQAVLAVCKGKGFTEVRDTAVIRTLADTGIRVAECVGLLTDDDQVDMTQDTIFVMGKGARQRVVPFGAKAGVALDRYQRARARHPQRALPQFWLSPKGALTDSGVRQLLERRCIMAGVPVINPHGLRHLAVHMFLEAGGSEGDAMRIFGWRTRAMLDRYGAFSKDKRAHASKRMRSPGDQI